MSTFKWLSNSTLNVHIGKSAVYSPYGRRVLILDYNAIKEWDRETYKCLRTFKGHSNSVSIAVYSPNGRRVLSVSSWDGTIKEWDRETGKCLRTVKFLRSVKEHSGVIDVKSVAYSPDGRRVLILYNETVKHWDMETGKCQWSISPYSGVFIAGCGFNDCKYENEETKELIRIHGGKDQNRNRRKGFVKFITFLLQTLRLKKG